MRKASLPVRVACVFESSGCAKNYFEVVSTRGTKMYTS